MLSATRHLAVVMLPGALLLAACGIEPNPTPFGDGEHEPPIGGNVADDANGAPTAVDVVDPMPPDDAGTQGDVLGPEDASPGPDQDTGEEEPDPSELEGPFPLVKGHVARYLWVDSPAGGDKGIVILAIAPEGGGSTPFKGHLPAVIEVPGGLDAGKLPTPDTLQVEHEGVLHVRLALPSGGVGHYRSGGLYDHRGADCQRAVADVLRFLRGEGTLTDGRSVDDVFDAGIDTQAIGLLGLSNGGNLAVTTLALSDGLEPTCWIGLWESPIADTFVTVELGGRGEDPDQAVDADGNGVSWDDMVHLDYAPGECTIAMGCPVSHENLVWADGVLFSDNDGDGVLGDGNGALDTNGNGRRDADEDIVYAGAAGTDGQVVYTTAATQAAEAQGVFGGTGGPANIASSEQAATHWEARVALGHLASMTIPHAMVLGSGRDHVQAAKDSPHVWLAYKALLASGAWTRLNPDSVYVDALGGPAADTVEHAANVEIEPIGLGQKLSPWLPKNVTQRLRRAAVREMSARCLTGNWSADLTTPIALP